MRIVHKFTAMTSIRMVWPFLSLARKHGRVVNDIATRLGLTDAQLSDRATCVPTRVLSDLLAEAVARSGERDLGLLAARWVDAGHFGVCEYLARSRPTLRAAIEDTSRYAPLLASGFGHRLEARGKLLIAHIWFSPDLEMHEAAYEFAVASGVLRARRMTGDDTLAPVAIHFMHPQPENTARHRAIFRCPIHFGADSTQVVMLADALDMPLPAAEPALADILARQAEVMLERLPRADFTSRVLTLLGGEIALTDASVKYVARRFGVSVRNLSRRLADEGTSYRAIIDRVRRQAALAALSRDRDTIEAIADELGFASSQSFHRAFRRWTGTTAHVYRRHMREQRGA